VYLVGFTIEIYYDTRYYKRQVLSRGLIQCVDKCQITSILSKMTGILTDEINYLLPAGLEQKQKQQQFHGTTHNRTGYNLLNSSQKLPRSVEPEYSLFTNLAFSGPCIVIYSYNKTN